VRDYDVNHVIYNYWKVLIVAWQFSTRTR